MPKYSEMGEAAPNPEQLLRWAASYYAVITQSPVVNHFYSLSDNTVNQAKEDFEKFFLDPQKSEAKLRKLADSASNLYNKINKDKIEVPQDARDFFKLVQSIREKRNYKEGADQLFSSVTSDGEIPDNALDVIQNNISQVPVLTTTNNADIFKNLQISAGMSMDELKVERDIPGARRRRDQEEVDEKNSHILKSASLSEQEQKAMDELSRLREEFYVNHRAPSNYTLQELIERLANRKLESEGLPPNAAVSEVIATAELYNIYPPNEINECLNYFDLNRNILDEMKSFISNGNRQNDSSALNLHENKVKSPITEVPESIPKISLYHDFFIEHKKSTGYAPREIVESLMNTKLEGVELTQDTARIIAQAEIHQIFSPDEIEQCLTDLNIPRKLVDDMKAHYIDYQQQSSDFLKNPNP